MSRRLTSNSARLHLLVHHTLSINFYESFHLSYTTYKHTYILHKTMIYNEYCHHTIQHLE